MRAFEFRAVRRININLRQLQDTFEFPVAAGFLFAKLAFLSNNYRSIFGEHT